MSPVILPPGFAHAQYSMSLSGDAEPMMVTAAWALASPINQSTADAMADVFAAAWKSIAPDEVEFLGVHVTEGQDGDPTVWDGITTVPNRFGTNTSNYLPPNCATLVRKVTGLGGRKNRGRFYWPFTPEADCDQVGNLDGDWRAATDGAAELWLANTVALAAIGGMVILHSSLTPPPTTVVALITEPKLATQRRRLRP